MMRGHADMTCVETGLPDPKGGACPVSTHVISAPGYPRLRCATALPCQKKAVQVCFLWDWFVFFDLVFWFVWANAIRPYCWANAIRPYVFWLFGFCSFRPYGRLSPIPCPEKY